MANISLQILDSFAFTIESLKYAEAARHYYEQLGNVRNNDDGGGENEPCLNDKSAATLLASASSPTPTATTTSVSPTPPAQQTSSKKHKKDKKKNKSVGLAALHDQEPQPNKQEPLPPGKTESQPEPEQKATAPTSAPATQKQQQQKESAKSNQQPSEGGLPSLSKQIAAAREHIQEALQGKTNLVSSPLSAGSGAITEEDLAMREENTRLKKEIDDLANQVKQLKDRVSKLEAAAFGGGGQGKITSAPPPKTAGDTKKPADDDDDVDLFGSDEEDEDAAKVREQRLAEYAAKKSKKPALVAKSNVILDVKPWDDETDMKELENAVRTIEMDGLLWGASKLVPLAYGIKKLQIATVIEDDKVSVDELQEKIEAFEDFVQSVDIAAFNKI